MSNLRPYGRQLSVGMLVLAAAFAPAAGRLAPAAAVTAAPAEPVWPAPDLVTDMHGLLVKYYDQEATAATPFYLRAPEWESDKQAAAKDPDTLWEHFGGPGTACHGAADDDAFRLCTAHRVAAALGLRVAPGAALFDVTASYQASEAVARLAGMFGLYHSFAYDFDALDLPSYTAATARSARAYHGRMIRAYERHMRDILVGMFRDRRADAQFQLDMTRSVGELEVGYVRLVEACEERGLWASTNERRNALALVNGLNQRLWWEWVWTQVDGPRTAGFVDLGSESTWLEAAAADQRWAATGQFVNDGVAIPSLRPATLDSGRHDGLWFDADYAVPGEWWCKARYPGGSASLAQCLVKAGLQSQGGTYSPFGQYYGPPGDCDSRADDVTLQSCGITNLGSIAKEWTWTFLGARLGMYLMAELASSGDADLPSGAIGPNEVEVVTARLGYGIAGWHGGMGYQDDLEWQFAPPRTVAIRTLSAGRHDMEMQNGRFSLGETDTYASSVQRKGDTWDMDAQEFPGGLEGRSPGPNPYEGSRLFALVLSDKTSAGLSGSLYDQYSRNEVDEFNSWIWLMLASYFRCTGVNDPADPSCFAYSAGMWPSPVQINRSRLYSRPEDGAMNLRFRYLWLDLGGAAGPLLNAASIGERDRRCRAGSGLPWRNIEDWRVDDNAGLLVDEAGNGAYVELLQGFGGLMRLIAARYPVEPLDPSLAADYEVQRAEVLAPWYGDMYNQVRSILALYSTPYPDGYGYVPEAENSTCAGADPMLSWDPTSVHMLSWQVGTGDSNAATVAHRATWYSSLAEWYWFYDPAWLEVDAAVW